MIYFHREGEDRVEARKRRLQTVDHAQVWTQIGTNFKHKFAQVWMHFKQILCLHCVFHCSCWDLSLRGQKQGWGRRWSFYSRGQGWTTLNICRFLSHNMPYQECFVYNGSSEQCHGCMFCLWLLCVILTPILLLKKSHQEICSPLVVKRFSSKCMLVKYIFFNKTGTAPRINSQRLEDV